MSIRVRAFAWYAWPKIRLSPGRTSADVSLSWAASFWSLNGSGTASLTAVGAPAGTNAVQFPVVFSEGGVSVGYMLASIRLLPGRTSASVSLSWAAKCWSRNGWGKIRLTAAGAPRGTSAVHGRAGSRGAGGSAGDARINRHVPV